MNNDKIRLLLPVRSATDYAWREVLPDAPLLTKLHTDSFDGFRIHGTDHGIGLFDDQWVLVHVQAAEADVVVSQGPFDFHEQAIAALIAQVAGGRALGVLGDLP